MERKQSGSDQGEELTCDLVHFLAAKQQLSKVQLASLFSPIRTITAAVTPT
jgi:hypothetical protein